MGGGGKGQSMLGGLMGQMNDPTSGDVQSMLDPMGIIYKPPPPTPPFLDPQQALPTMATPQSTDRLAFLRSFGLQG
jgi:hypothetical protein